MLQQVEYAGMQHAACDLRGHWSIRAWRIQHELVQCTSTLMSKVGSEVGNECTVNITICDITIYAI